MEKEANKLSNTELESVSGGNGNFYSNYKYYTGHKGAVLFKRPSGLSKKCGSAPPHCELTIINYNSGFYQVSVNPDFTIDLSISGDMQYFYVLERDVMVLK
ncbi:MAG: hypothetical protein K5985_07705 [Lachnospiraceae bacterium]|nr:hypothetical protein [Lachnospiraceae bacterium]